MFVICFVLLTVQSALNLMNNGVQPNTNDSGVYAIAFAVSLAFGKESAHLYYDNSKMRTHLLNCIESGILTEFPSKPESRKNLFIQAHTIPLQCTCRTPESVRGPGFDTRSGNILSFLLPLFQEGQMSVTGESMCTKYW